jgi:hypothetical protein
MIELTPDILTYFLHHPDYDRIQYFVTLDYIKAPYAYAWDDPAPIFWKSFKEDLPYLFREECWAVIYNKRIVSEYYYLSYLDPSNLKYFDINKPYPRARYPWLSIEAVLRTKLLRDPTTKVNRNFGWTFYDVEYLNEILKSQWFYPDITDIGLEEIKIPPEKIEPVELFETYFMNFFS